jgi:hypothetical protein
MVALQKNLVAAADTHHLVADLVEARSGIAGAEQGEDRGAEQKNVSDPADSLARARIFCRLEHFWTSSVAL